MSEAFHGDGVAIMHQIGNGLSKVGDFRHLWLYRTIVSAGHTAGKPTRCSFYIFFVECSSMTTDNR
jgi:hypothetical protein